MTSYDTVLFDSDGVLVDPPSYETKVEAVQSAFEEVGVTRAEKRHVDAIVNGTTVEGLHEICAAYDLDTDLFWEARERHDEQSQFEKFEAGSRSCYDDVTAISGLSQRCGVVSNNHRSTIEFVLDFFDLESAFETYYGREKTVESLDLKKPNTHYLDRALTELGGESALYIGDSESDVIAAHRAGVDSVFVSRPHCRDTDLSVTPTYETDSLHGVAKIANGDGRAYRK
ncbi:HAD family hydrolase [Halopelagius fulvigenes]|uniref:HAD family hydrolase n=1 Tax=Halopelagius fulvigenes TaxID=1198324 RepID=A0ABD5TVX0_9EURY